MGRPKLNMLGQRSGRLLVVEASLSVRGHAMWRCLCDCGNYVDKKGSALGRGDSTSCGCLTTEKRSDNAKTHGLSQTKTYWIWHNMKHRCADSDHPSWSNYGGRGITVCDRWLESVNNFIEDMGERPTGKTLDRIDGDKGYYKENCQWITHKQNCNKKRNTPLIFFKGESLTVSGWAEKLGIKQTTLNMRLKSYKWSVEDALTKPVRILANV